MAVQPTLTFPGVYVQEVPSGVRTIVGVSTSICSFVGRTRAGPLLRPTRIQNFTDFVRVFGDDPSVGDLSRYVRLFFLNGGTDCYITRIANGAVASTVTLHNEAKTPTLQLTAKDAGVLGDSIRAAVSYDTQFPERTFNLELFRSVIDARGQRVKADRETWTNLSMDPNAGSYAQTVLTQKSKLVDATDLGVPPSPGYSLAGVPIGFDTTIANAGDFRAQLGAALGAASPKKRAFRVSVDGNPFVNVVVSDDFTDAVAFPGITEAVLTPLYEAAIAGRINNALSLAGQAGVTVDVFLDAGPSGIAPRDKSVVLRIQSKANGDVLVQSAGVDDAALPLALGTANGGVEVGARAAARPAPTGVAYEAYDLPRFAQTTALVNLPHTGATAITSVTLDAFDATGALVAKTVAPPFTLGDTPAPPAGTPLWDSATGPVGLATRLARLRDAVNAFQALDPAAFRWRAEIWGSRIAFVPTAGGADDMPPFATAATDLAASSTVNVRYYRLGAGGAGAFQSLGAAGSDGGPPVAGDYDLAYDRIDHDVDIFNLLVLPPEDGGIAPEKLYSAASVFCQRRRAFLIMDPPDSWTAVQTATSLVAALRIGLVKDYSAVYYPRLTIPENGLDVTVGAAGAVAGLYARIDGTRGVWKAPAGTEATFRGVTGVDLNLTDGENGQLNPLGINAIRVMPEGIVSWGARTNDGADIFASEYKYIPIRRLALLIEESLYRGLKWVVFEPNDEALWAQIRLNVGAFMQNLFRQGAFQGTTPRQAFFVKVDAETTTQADRDLGVVNVWVGFAPVKPAEFVILYIQQIAGQIET